MTRKLILPLALALPLVAGCTPNDIAMGSAMRHNAALQTIDPEPAAQTAATPGDSGDHAGLAVERYRRGTVKEPVAQTTTTGARGGSGGGGQAGPR